MKPVALVERSIANSSAPRALVLHPFIGLELVGRHRSPGRLAPLLLGTGDPLGTQSLAEPFAALSVAITGRMMLPHVEDLLNPWGRALVALLVPV
jgi:hypothetical protein